MHTAPRSPSPDAAPRARGRARVRGLAALALVSGGLAADCGGGGGGGGGRGDPPPPGSTRVYVAADDHTDYFWTADDTAYRQAFLDTLDYYLDQVDATAGAAPEHQSRWNCDGNLWLWEYEHAKSPLEFQRLIDAIASGHVSVPLNPLCVCLGGANLELVLRGMYYPGRIERQHGLRFPLAYAMENQTLPLGLASLWAGAGAKYSWRGICNCDTQISAGDRPFDIYRALGRDGKGVLMKWNTLLGAGSGQPNQSLGGYAEAFDPSNAIDVVTSDAPTNGFAANYPYAVIGVFGQGWDNFQTQDQDVVLAAVAKSDATRQVIVSNERDFFEDFEATYGSAGLPSQVVSHGNEWDLYCSGLAEVTSRLVRAAEKLRAAEALATLECQFDATFMDGREAARDLAFLGMGLFFEHDFGMVGAPTGAGGVTGRIAWQRQLADDVDAYVDSLHADGRAALGARIDLNGAANERFYAFNPLSFARTDVADYPYAGPTPVRVIDVTAVAQVPSQVVTIQGQTFLRVLASDVPAMGYRVFEIRSGAGTAFGDAATVSGGTIENSLRRATLDPSGAISSLIDRSQGDREFAAVVGGRVLNDLGGSGGSLTVENAGPVSVTLVATSNSPVAHVTRLTLVRDSGRVDVENRIEQNFTDVQSWSFGMALTTPAVRHEELGAILLARRASNGGHYADSGARTDWLTLNHFVDASEASGVGLTVANADCRFFRRGNSTATTLDVSTPRLDVLAGGNVANGGNGLPNQGGDSLFVQRFALVPHAAWSPTAAMREALAQQNPLVCAQVSGNPGVLPDTTFSAFSCSDPDVLLWSLKPSEEGPAAGFIARLWNVSEGARTAALQLAPNPLTSAARSTHIETDEAALNVNAAGLTATFAAQEIRTFRLRVQ